MTSGTTPAGGRQPEVRTSYILKADPRRVKGRLMPMRDILSTAPGGHRSVAVTVPSTVAIDVLEALRAAYQQGREDNARQHAS